MQTNMMSEDAAQNQQREWFRPALSVFALAEVTQLGKLGSEFDGVGQPANFSPD